MRQTANSAIAARFGAFAADLRTGELRKHDRKIRLARLPFQVLAMLLEHPGELVTRVELRSRLWGADTFVDFEHGMNSAIRKLRAALGDSANKPRYVETLPRRGYRFIAAVEMIGGDARPVEISRPAELPAKSWVGHVATLSAADGGNFVLLPVDEETLLEKESYEAANDDLGITLMVAAERLLLVANGTTVKILEARQPLDGCRVRILQGQFIGVIAFAPRKCLGNLAQSAKASS